ncbi:MAG: phage terminase large subunit [Patescibacteria group bacterium]
MTVDADIVSGARRRRLLQFVRADFPEYEAGWFHRDVCSRLEAFSRAVAEKRSPRLMLFAPPRHGKSFLTSERFPVWHLGRHPEHEVIVASYSFDAAKKRSKAARTLARLDLTRDTFDLELDAEAFAVDEWYTTRGGRYQAVGTGGSITGGGANVLIIDDPVKDWAVALSPTQRESIWDWYQSTAYTRLSPGGGVLVIQTRWHEDDLAGRLLRAMDAGEGDRWEVVDYPAIAERDELHRRAGEALHAERWPLERLEKIRVVVGSRKWQALYQGRPSFEGGNIWKASWWRFWTRSPLTPDQESSGKWMVLPEKVELIQSWDLTLGSLSDTASWAVGQVWAKCRADRFLLDEIRFRGGILETEAAIRELSRRWPAAGKKYVESAALGKPLEAKLRHDIPGIILVPVDQNKAARMEACVPEVEAGNVYLPDPMLTPWVRDWIDECAAAPHGPANDRADSASQGLTKLRTPSTIRMARV